MFKLDIKPLSHRLKNNRDAHEDYLKKTIENTNTICGLVERARKQNLSKPFLDSAYKLTKDVQELLVYVSQTCPSFTKPTMYVDANHDVCFFDFVNDMNVRSKSKSDKKSQQHSIWKPTGKVFTEVGHKWKPTGRIFTIVGNLCPLTRITPTKVVHLKETTSNSGKSKKSSHQPKAEDTNQEKIYLLHMDLCGLIRVASVGIKSLLDAIGIIAALAFVNTAQD
nr:hypothetical protein [Tanacetum cinerariifolium]